MMPKGNVKRIPYTVGAWILHICTTRYGSGHAWWVEHAPDEAHVPSQIIPQDDGTFRMSPSEEQAVADARRAAGRWASRQDALPRKGAAPAGR